MKAIFVAPHLKIQVQGREALGLGTEYAAAYMPRMYGWGRDTSTTFILLSHNRVVQRDPFLHYR